LDHQPITAEPAESRTMLVSVVIPAYNAEQWIGEAIESVLNQTYRVLEIILVDDGSKDQTAEVAQKSLLKSDLPRRVIRQQNAGAAGARNRGWQSATGSLVQFLDADDYLEPEKIDAQVRWAAIHPTADVIYSDWQMLVPRMGSWAPGEIRYPIIREDAVADLISTDNFLQLGCLLFKKTILEAAGGFDKPHEPIEDVGLYIKIAMSGGSFTKAPSQRPLSYYRDVPQSFSKLSHRRFIESCVKNTKLAEEYVRQNPSGSSRVVESIVEAYYLAARFFAGEDWKRFDEIVRDIERLQPNFIPKSPSRMRILSKLSGYRNAERFASIYRRGKKATSV
jgi:glycosyltransferase involved in cell wall biosynthesis